MNPRKGYFSIVQYCPDLARRESVNIGIVLFVPEAEFLESRMVEDNERVRHFFGIHGDDLKRLRLFKKSFASRIHSEGSRITSLDALEKFIHTRGNQIQLTSPAFVKVRDCRESLSQLFDKLVGSGSRGPKREAFNATLVARFEHAGIADRIRRDIPVEVPILNREMKIPFGFQNGSFHLLQPVRFETGKEESNFRTACKHSTEGKIFQSHVDPNLGPLRYNVIGRFPSKDDRSIPIVRQVLAESDVRLHLEDELCTLVDEIRATGKRLDSDGK